MGNLTTTTTRRNMMKLCSGSFEEVRWSYINQPKCRTCGMWVGWKVLEEIDGFVDVAKRHFPNGNAVNTGSREGKWR